MGNSPSSEIRNGSRWRRPLNSMQAILVFATNPAVLRYASELLTTVFKMEVRVFSSLCSLSEEGLEVQAVILGPQFLSQVSEVRERFPDSFILGIADWCHDVPGDFHRWGNQIKDLATPFAELLDSWKPELQEQNSEG